jgi:hypothetical protein
MRDVRLSQTDRAACEWFRAALHHGTAKKLRVGAGLTLREVARIVGAPTHGTIRKWEALESRPRYSALAARTARFYRSLPPEAG